MFPKEISFLILYDIWRNGWKRQERLAQVSIPFYIFGHLLYDYGIIIPNMCTGTQQIYQSETALKLFYDLKLLSLVFNSHHIPVTTPASEFIRRKGREFTNILRPPKPQNDYLENSVAYQWAILWNSIGNMARSSNIAIRF